MSEEEKFKRSEVGHDANDLHKHGGPDAHEEKTEREDLEDAIEELNDSEEIENLEEIEKDIAGDNNAIEDDTEQDDEDGFKEHEAEPKSEEKPTEEPKEEPVNDWKVKAENQAYMTVDEVVEPGAKAKKKGGAGWKVATFLFLLLLLVACGGAAYLFFTNNKIEFAGRTMETYKTGSKPEKPVEQPVAKKPKFNYEEAKLDFTSLRAMAPSGSIFEPFKIDYTKDGKYIFVIGRVNQGANSFYGTWYREAKKGSEWQKLITGKNFSSCADYTEEQKELMENYKYLDDDLGSRYIGCYEDVNNKTVFPE